MLWCFLGIFGDKKGRNTNIFLKRWCRWWACGAGCASSLACPLVQVVRLFGVVPPFVACSPISSAFLLCSRCVVLEICLYSHFKGVFSAVWGCCAGLCCLGALRGLWGFCVREWLGGFGACCVFASVFLLLLLCLPPFMLVVLLCSGCLSLSSCIVFVALGGCGCWCCFFPFG